MGKNGGFLIKALVCTMIVLVRIPRSVQFLFFFEKVATNNQNILFKLPPPHSLWWYGQSPCFWPSLDALKLPCELKSGIECIFENSYIFWLFRSISDIKSKIDNWVLLLFLFCTANVLNVLNMSQVPIFDYISELEWNSQNI